MAETLISPGVLARENDSSFVSEGPIRNTAAIVGPTVKGPVEIPTVVTSYSEYENIFGTTLTSGSLVYSYFTSITAFNYFSNGGETLLVSRVANTAANYAPASSSADLFGSAALNATNGVTFNTKGDGVIYNSDSTLDAQGSLLDGTVDNLRWEVTNSDVPNGTFDLLVRRGDDNTDNKIVLEAWTGLSLDPLASNFVSKVIGDMYENYDSVNNQIDVLGNFKSNSRYLYVSSIDPLFLTPNYFDNNGVAKAAFAPAIPVNASGSFGAGEGDIINGVNFYENIADTNTQGLVAADYTDMISLLANQDDYKFNTLTTPGLFNSGTALATPIANAINNTQGRGDSIYVMDLVDYGSTVQQTTVQAAARNTSYAASYWPWLQVIEPNSGQLVWVPASVLIPSVYAFNDSVSEPWFAPAGINRGGLDQVVRPEVKLTQAQRDSLYSGKVNPIASFPATGVVVYGQKTLQTKASALDRVNVRRLLIALKNYISDTAQTLVFEQNTIATRNAFISQVNPYLETVQQNQGLYAFKVIMDESNNSADVIDRNQMIGQIYIQPTKTAEFIYLDFNILPTGATFPA
jgi:hypothetical protein|tara:strand:+ start:665 stop:2392 length:1728 start_codon:yes stop_codon:yes gene_type:complete